MLQIRMMEAEGQKDKEKISNEIFGPEFLIKRPLYQAIDHDGDNPPVLLIDELDRADEEFEAFLLEILSDFQISIPEIGTIKSSKPPVVVITSNRTREIHDALKRRCLYHWIEYPSAEQELEIVSRKVPDINEALGKQVVAFVQIIRQKDFYKLPGIAETLDWADALTQLDKVALDSDTIDNTLGALLKYQDDISRIRGSEAAQLLEQVKLELANV